MNNYRIPKSALKTNDELLLIEESCRIVADTLVLLKDYVKPGVTTIELDRIAEDYVKSKDGYPAFKGFQVGKLVFPSSLCISVNEEVIHGIPGKRVLNDGDVVSLDCGVIKNGYYGDSAITYPVGNISVEDNKLLEVTEKSLLLGIEQVKLGNSIYDMSRVIQTYVESNGFSLTREYCGHGLGKELHEFPAVPNFVPPLLQRKDFPNIKFFNNMVIAIEPMVHFGKKDIRVLQDRWTVVTKDGSKAAHFEHTVVVNNNNPLILTSRN